MNKKTVFCTFNEQLQCKRFISPFLSQLSLAVPLFRTLAISGIVEQIHLFAPNKLCNISFGTHGQIEFMNECLARTQCVRCCDVTHSLTWRL